MPFGFQQNNIETNVPDSFWRSPVRTYELPEPKFIQNKPVNIDAARINNFTLNYDSFKFNYSPTSINSVDIQPPKLNIAPLQINFPK